MVEIDIKKRLNMTDGWKTLTVKTQIQPGEFITIFGKSGAGKTTLLRMIAGLSKPDCGLIRTENKIWYDSKKNCNIPVQKRNIGFVFQTPALFPNMSVMENLRYGAGKNYDKDYLQKLLQTTELELLGDRKPQTLSGGQQQRISLIRALARKPKLVLLDEPFSSLDVSMRRELRKALFMLHQEFQLTTILVSHDLEDLQGKANRLIKIENGKTHEETVPHTLVTNEWTGKIRKINQTKIGALIEIDIEGEVIKIPVDSALALTLRENTSVRLSMDYQGNLQRISRLI